MKRRTFLKLSSISAAASALAGCQKSNEKLIPFLIPPEDDATPGQADYYATTCRQCPAGCGMLVKVAAGRAKKVEGNPRHPLNQGKLCARGQAVLQELYHPDRIKQPLKRSGPRGSGAFTPISWKEGLTLLMEKLEALRQDGATERVLLWTPPVRGSLVTLIEHLRASYGEFRHLAWEPFHPEWWEQSLLGRETTVDYDIENTQHLISFGADLFETHFSPVRFGHAFGRMRQSRPTVRGRFSYIGARLSMTAASADRWLPAKPGTEWVLALGMARQLLARGQYDRKGLEIAGIRPSDLEPLLGEYDLQRVAAATGIHAADIRSAFEELVAIRPAVAIAGEHVAWQSNGLASSNAIALLNLLLGSLNRPGGLQLTKMPGPTRSNSFAELRALLTGMRHGEVEVAMLQGVNPLYGLPPTTGIKDALDQIPTLVSFASILDDTARQADLILPDHSNLEQWGDVVPFAGLRQPVIGLVQPVVKPIYDTRSFPDTLLALSRGMAENDAQAKPGSYREWLQEHILNQINASGEQTWHRLLQQGGWFAPDQGGSIPLQTTRLDWGTVVRPTPARFQGEATDFPLHLQVYPSPFFNDGRNAHLPWLQQLPDPMTTAVWDSWLEINPRTAAELGIGHGDLVEVTSEQGSLQMPAVIYPGIRPDVVAIPIGQGHHGSGRYADQRGSNPLTILGLVPDNQQQLPAWGATRVRLKRQGKAGGLVTAGHNDGSYRLSLLGV